MTRKIQRCYLCEEPTGRTTEDQLELTCEKGPNVIVCEECFDDAERLDGTESGQQ